MKPRKLLVPVDFSEASRAGLRLAADWARQFQATITALHVESASGLFADSFALTGEIVKGGLDLGRHLAATRERLARFVAETIEPKEGSSIHCDVIEGLFVAEDIVRYAADRGHDWICMAATGRRGPMRMLLGSTAEEVVRRASVPVLTLRERTKKEADLLFDDFRRVLLATDLGEELPARITLASELAGKTGSVRLLHVIEMPPQYGLYGEPLVFSPESLEAASRWTGERLLAAAAPLGEERVAAPIVDRGDAAERILAQERVLCPDVTILGTHGRRGMDRLLLGSVASKIVRHALGPVLTIPDARAVAPPAN